MKHFLETSDAKEKIKAIQDKLKVNYYEFLWQVFVEEKELGWPEVIDLLNQKWNIKEKEDEKTAQIHWMDIAESLQEVLTQEEQ